MLRDKKIKSSAKSSGWQIPMNFLSKYRLRRLWHGFARAKIQHEMVWSMLLFLNDQMCLLISVEFLERSLRNDVM